LAPTLNDANTSVKKIEDAINLSKSGRTLISILTKGDEDSMKDVIKQAPDLIK
jgi:hypothetical protein